MRFSLFLALAAAVFLLDIPSMVVQAEFAYVLGALVVVVLFFAFAPVASDRRWKLALLPLLLTTQACEPAPERSRQRPTVLERLCEGYTLEVGSVVLCLRHVTGDELVWNEQGTQAVRERFVELVWFARAGHIVKGSELVAGTH